MRIRGLAGLVAVSLLDPHGSWAAEDAEARDESAGTSYSFETDFSSRYVFRGIAYSQGPVGQPSASATLAGLTVYAWSNVLLGRDAQQKTLSEIDFGASYSRSWKGLAVEPALDVFVYRYRADAVTRTPSTAEASIRLSYPVGDARLFTRQIVDVHAYRGAYYGEAGLSHERPLTRRVTVASQLSLGWASAEFNQAYAGVAGSALNVVGFEAWLAYAANRLTVKPHVELTYLCDHRLRERLASGFLLSFALTVALRR